MLTERRGVSRNTVHTLLVRLEEKGWLMRDTENGNVLFCAAVSRESTQQQCVQRLIDTVFDGSAPLGLPFPNRYVRLASKTSVPIPWFVPLADRTIELVLYPPLPWKYRSADACCCIANPNCFMLFVH